jgi:ABC-type Fe3+ transport system permease subunit
MIQGLVDFTPLTWLGDLLYRANSPAPVIWAYVLRFFPCAVVLLWPIVRSVPSELREMARLDGLRPLQEIRLVIWPLVWRSFAWTALVIAALCLGELAVSARVETPGAETFAKLILDRLHYGAAPDVAALCLVLLAVIALPALLVSWTWRVWKGT